MFAEQGVSVQLVNCVITNCIGVRGSATRGGWLQNCRVVGNRQSTNPSSVASSTTARRGVCWWSYMSGCVVGPNSYVTVGIDQDCWLWNCTVNETLSTLHLSADSHYFNVLDLNRPTYQTNIKVLTPGLCIETAANLALTNDYLKVADAQLADRSAGDFRPLVGSPVLSNATTNDVYYFSRFTLGGFHGGTLPLGRPVIGASYDAAIPVSVSNINGVTASGDMGTAFVSPAHPVTLTATDTGRAFMGYLVNGELATTERTLVLEAADGIASYTVEPLWESGTMLIFR